MDNQVKISVAICTYNRSDCTAKALNSLVKQTLQPEQYEILLVNNNSTDNTDALFCGYGKQHPNVTYRYVVELQQGLSHARNRAIAEAEGEIIIFMDDDAIAEPDYLEQVLKFFNSYPDVIACGGRIYPDFETKRPRWMSHFLLSLTSSIDLGNKVKSFTNRQFPIGANMAFRSHAFTKYGLFNPDLGRKGNNMAGAEEKDILYRMKGGGEKIYYVPDAIVHHYVPDSRLTYAFFKKQSLGIGSSEKVRAKTISTTEYINSLIREGLKWGVSGVLFLWYLFSLRPAMAWRLIVFRWYVSKGLLA